MPRTNENLKAATSVASIQRPPHESGKILQLQRRIKTLESEKRQLQKELEEQQRQTLIERQEKAITLFSVPETSKSSQNSTKSIGQTSTITGLAWQSFILIHLLLNNLP